MKENESTKFSENITSASQSDIVRQSLEKLDFIADHLNNSLTPSQKKKHTKEWENLSEALKNEIGENNYKDLVLPKLKPNNEEYSLEKDSIAIQNELEANTSHNIKESIWKNSIFLIGCFSILLIILIISLSYIYKTKDYTLSKEEFKKKSFFDSTFTPRPILIRNLSNESFELLTLTVISYEQNENKSLGKSNLVWNWSSPIERSFPPNTVIFEPLKTMAIPRFDQWNGTGVFASIYIRSKVPPFKEYSFSRIITPGFDKISADGALEIQPSKR